MRALRPSRAVAVSLRGGLAAAGGSGAGVPVAKADPGAQRPTCVTPPWMPWDPAPARRLPRRGGRLRRSVLEITRAGPRCARVNGLSTYRLSFRIIPLNFKLKR